MIVTTILKVILGELVLSQGLAALLDTRAERKHVIVVVLVLLLLILLVAAAVVVVTIGVLALLFLPHYSIKND